MYEDIVQLIEVKDVAFPAFGEGVSQASIDRAEEELDLALPPSYKWWLLNYGGGQIGQDIVYGLDVEDQGRADIVQLAKDGSRYGEQSLSFCIGNGEWFYFNTGERNDSGEYAVYLHEPMAGDPIKYADTFADFLRNRINELYR